MSTSDFDVLYAMHVRYVQDAYREYDRLGSRQSDFELRTGKPSSREQFQAALQQLEAKPLARARYRACIEQGFHAQNEELRERFRAASGWTGKQKLAA